MKAHSSMRLSRRAFFFLEKMFETKIILSWNSKNSKIFQSYSAFLSTHHSEETTLSLSLSFSEAVLCLSLSELFLFLKMKTLCWLRHPSHSNNTITHNCVPNVFTSRTLRVFYCTLVCMCNIQITKRLACSNGNFKIIFMKKTLLAFMLQFQISGYQTEVFFFFLYLLPVLKGSG